jgi:hypothetical protein
MPDVYHICIYASNKKGTSPASLLPKLADICIYITDEEKYMPNEYYICIFASNKMVTAPASFIFLSLSPSLYPASSEW